MCCQEKEIINPSKFFSLSHLKKVSLRCRCGRCSECRRVRRIEWSIRSRYEFKRCIDKGGFVLFDCLTYDDEHLPHLSDHIGAAVHTPFDRVAFNKDHLRKFWTRLNRKLRFKGFDIEGNLSHFVAGEYATDENYTKRPHYHILLFVNFKIDPVELSKIVQDCWSYGHTDGYPWKSRRYTLDHNVISDPVSSVKVGNYVSKYVLKPYSETDEIINCVKAVFRWLHPDQNGDLWLQVGDCRKRFDKVLRAVLPFHSVSPGYGSYALELYDDLADTLTVPLVGNTIKRVALPSYYFKKLFYDVVRDGDSVRWIPNDRYRMLSFDNINKVVDRDVSRFRSVLANMAFQGDIPSLNYVESLLDGRSLHDLAVYSNFYKGRYVLNVLPNPEQVVELSLERGSYDLEHLLAFGFPVLYGYHTSKDRERFKSTFFSNRFVGAFGVDACMKHDVIPDSCVLDHCYTQGTCPEFRFFDTLLDWLTDYDQYFRQVADAKAVADQKQLEHYDDLLNRARV